MGLGPPTPDPTGSGSGPTSRTWQGAAPRHSHGIIHMHRPTAIASHARTAPQVQHHQCMWKVVGGGRRGTLDPAAPHPPWSLRPSPVSLRLRLLRRCTKSRWVATACYQLCTPPPRSQPPQPALPPQAAPSPGAPWCPGCEGLQAGRSRLGGYKLQGLQPIQAAPHLTFPLV